jgi:hypothetical protein
LYDVSVLLSANVDPVQGESMPIGQFIKSEMESADIKRLSTAYAKGLRMLQLQVCLSRL